MEKSARTTCLLSTIHPVGVGETFLRDGALYYWPSPFSVSAKRQPSIAGRDRRLTWVSSPIPTTRAGRKTIRAGLDFLPNSIQPFADWRWIFRQPDWLVSSVCEDGVEKRHRQLAHTDKWQLTIVSACLADADRDGDSCPAVCSCINLRCQIFIVRLFIFKLNNDK